MNTFIYISLGMYIPFMAWFLIMAWRCKSPAFGKLELILFGLLTLVELAIYQTWVLPAHVGWFTKLGMALFVAVVRGGVHMLIHATFSPFKPGLRHAFRSWFERCTALDPPFVLEPITDEAFQELIRHFDEIDSSK